MRFASLLLILVAGCSQSPTPAPIVPSVVPTVVVQPSDAIADQLLSIHNENRSNPLAINSQLMKAAQDHADWMAINHRMSHTGDRRSSPGQRIKSAGYDWSTYGENVAYGQSTPAEVMRVWLHSPGHRRNIKSESYDEIGIGYATASNGRIYWCVDFGRRGFGGDGWDETWATPELGIEGLQND